jgi:hypothetical protein
MTESVKVPELVDYPEFFDVTENIEMFNGSYSYIIEPYDLKNGINLYIGFRDDVIIRRAANFQSYEFDLREENADVSTILLWSHKLTDLMKSIRVTDASFYFSKDKQGLLLVDVMIAANKFLGPGMLLDLFGHVVPTQKVIDTVVLDKENIPENKGKLVKTSRFKIVFDNDSTRPQYGLI